jgi:hypothetical protein
VPDSRRPHRVWIPAPLCENRPATTRPRISLDPDKKNKGDPAMGDTRPAVPRHRAFRDLALERVQRLVTGSLTLYLAATLAQRTWEVLNSDVGVLLRRLQ